MMEKHPVAVLSTILTTILVAATGVIWNQLDNIQDVQKEIQEELATQSQLLTAIRNEQDGIEARQLSLNESLARMSKDIGFIEGYLYNQHENAD